MKSAVDTLSDELEYVQESDSNGHQGSDKTHDSDPSEDDLLAVESKDLSKILSDEVCVNVLAIYCCANDIWLSLAADYSGTRGRRKSSIPFRQ